MARVSIKDYATTRSVSEDRIRSLLVGFNPNVRKNGDEYTVDSDTLDKLFRLEEEAKRASSLRSELDKRQVSPGRSIEYPCRHFYVGRRGICDRRLLRGWAIDVLDNGRERSAEKHIGSH